ncbi:hypothetical protein ACHQM5_010120 [Ranunculus cassubicifolius]
MALKGKQIASKTPPLKRKRDDPDKSGSRKRSNPAVLQFFDVDAHVDEDDTSEDDDDDDDLDFDSDSMEEVNAGKTGKGGKTRDLPFFPKEEEMSDDELEQYLEERYKPGSRHVVYAEDRRPTEVSDEQDYVIPSEGDPHIWRVKCTVGKERLAAFCLIQKFVDLKSLGNKMKIVSVIAPDHVKGYIYIEAEREFDIFEACKGISTIYTSRTSPVPKNEIAHVFSIRNTSIELPPGTWVRVKFGRYRGDLAQVVAFNDKRKRATLKLIPRIDLQALGKKLAGGGTTKQTGIPAARVIKAKDFEELRSYITVKRDNQTGRFFETIDGLKFKEGYLYKKVSIESISYVDVVPTADDILKFKPHKKDGSDDAEWLSRLYGEQRKKKQSECSKETGKSSEGTSGTKKANNFQLQDLVFFGPKEFGVIIGVESDSFQILKYDDVEGAEVLNVENHEITHSSFDRKFTTMDQNMKVIAINDTVRIMGGPFMGRQGVVKHICRGIIFIYDENQLENGGYLCAKSKSCEHICQSGDANLENTGDVFGAQGFQEPAPSPKSPQLSKKPWQDKENTGNFNSRRQGDRDGGFSVGQTVRIRVGPLKGHLCRIISIYRSNVTVKVNSQTKILSVKSEHLSGASAKSSFMNQNDGFGNQEASGAPTESGGWGSAPLTTERSTWGDLSASDNLFGSSLTTPALEKEEGDDPWGTKATAKKGTSSWGNATAFGEDSGKAGGDDPWGTKVTSEKPIDSCGNATGGDPEGGGDPWGTKASTSKGVTESWGNATGGVLEKDGGDDLWGNKATTSKEATNSWGGGIGSALEEPAKGQAEDSDPWGSKQTPKNTTESSWGITNTEDKGKDVAEKVESGWGSAAVVQNNDTGKIVAGNDWGAGVGNNGQSNQDDSWGKATQSWKANDSSSNVNSEWGKPNDGATNTGWNSQKSSDGDRGFNGNGGGMDDGQDSWNKPRDFDGGRGSGGRRGRGGFRGNGDQSGGGRGRGFGRGRSSDWNGGSRDNEKTGNDFGGQGSTWGNSSQGAGENTSQGGGWDNKASSWKSGAADADAKISVWGDASGDLGAGWGNTSHDDGGKASQGDGWGSKSSSGATDAGGNTSSGWGGANKSDTNHASGWGSGATDLGASKSSGRGSESILGTPPKNSDTNQSSGWGSGAAGPGANKSSGWGSESILGTPPKKSDTNQASGWGSGAADPRANNKSSGWGGGVADSGANKSSGWGSGASDSGANKSSTWGSGAADAGANKSSGWGSGAADWGANKSTGWGSGDASGDNGGGKSYGGGRTSGGWGGGGRDSEGGGRGFGRGNRGRGRDGDSSDFSNRGRGGFGRGGSRGGFSNGGRGGNDDGELSGGGRGFGRGGRGRFSNGGRGDGESSGRGGFGRGGRGGFNGGRGRGRRDESDGGGGGWSNGGNNDASGGGWSKGSSWSEPNQTTSSWGNNANVSGGAGNGGGGWGAQTESGGGGWNKSGGAKEEASGSGGDDAWGKAASSWGSGGSGGKSSW